MYLYSQETVEATELTSDAKKYLKLLSVVEQFKEQFCDNKSFFIVS